MATTPWMLGSLMYKNNHLSGQLSNWSSTSSSDDGKYTSFLIQCSPLCCTCIVLPINAASIVVSEMTKYSAGSHSKLF